MKIQTDHTHQSDNTTSSKIVVIKRKPSAFVEALQLNALRFLIVGGFLLLWEVTSGRWIAPFFISSPSAIYRHLSEWVLSGDIFSMLALRQPKPFRAY